MPELPEVETIARSLRNAAGLDFATWQGLNARPGIVGRTIYSATVNWSRSIATPEIEVFRQQISGQVVQGVNRRGKFLVLQLDRDWLLIHLRMSGDVRVEPADSGLVQPHDRVILDFQDGTRLVFNDPRKFGRLWLVSHPDEVLSGLGPEPLAVELTPATFYAMLHARKTPVKPLLMDQRFICGLGNIYTDEALHQAQIHPLQKAHTLSHEESERLLSTIRDVLREGIQRNGASIDWVYRGGDFQNYFRVYQRTGKPCLRCGTAIERIVVGQRGTHFCPLCQVIH
jgi:formamidopyrimidine-DNA glycosylase